MSTNRDKFVNSQRRHRDENAVKRQVKIARQHGMQFKDQVIKEPHRLAKHHAMDCGQPGCVLCGNPRRNKRNKTKDRLTTQERRAFQDTNAPNSRHNNGLPNTEDPQ
jgi:hypothetical protein